MLIKLPYKFKPRHYQSASLRAQFIEGKLFGIDLIHRRAGKSKTSLNRLIIAGMLRVGNYYHCFPELKQARRAIWDNVDSDGMRYMDHVPKELKAGQNNTEMRVDLINGSSIYIGGSDRYDALMGGNPLGIIFDEYSLQNPLAWHYLSPILTENNGFGWFPYTSRGYNHGYELYDLNKDNPLWFVQKLDITQTKKLDGSPIITMEQIEERRRSGTPEELIQQEYFLSFESALVGAVYKEEIAKAMANKQFLTFQPKSDLPIHTAWDIGVRDATSIWFFQAAEGKIWVVHYYENTRQGMDHYIGYAKGWMERQRCKNGINFAPHDIKVQEWTNGRTRIDEAASRGFYFKVVPNISIMDGINAVRSIFPILQFDQVQCKHGINALKQYEYADDNKPKHSWASHAADAMRYLALGWHDCYRSEVLYSQRTMSQWRP